MIRQDFFQDGVDVVASTDTLDSNQTMSPSFDTSTTPATTSPQYLRFISVALSSHLLKATVEISNTLISLLHAQTIELFRDGNFEGFERSNIPAEYIEDSYRNEINITMKNYLLHHLVIDFLVNELLTRKIHFANYPRLTSIERLSDKKINYHFDISTSNALDLKEWKLFSFKSPKRKRYKDLDKQVITFIETSPTQSKKNPVFTAEEQDWVLFEAIILNNQEVPISPSLTSSFWFRIQENEVAEPFSQNLMNKEIGKKFTTKNFSVHQQNQKCDEHSFHFLVTIKAIVKGSYFSVEAFKASFKLKNKTEIHNKLMEVFSYRDDVSQRRAIIEEVFHLLLAKHRFEVPKHLVLRREEDILQALIHQPDYHAYKAQKDFESYVEMLAEKQLKEEIIIDQIAYNENIKSEVRDVSNYLHLLSNKRLKEFIYFKPVLEVIDDSSTAINTTTLTQAVIREKTLNHIIYTLTK